jgi:3-dehydrosphinganine reductase
MRTNVEGSVNAARSAFSLGSLTRIMLVSSMAGQVGITGFSAYSASKFALRGLAESLAMELKPNGVSVTLAFPPDTETPLLEAENARKPDETSAVSGSGGMAKARTVARSIIAAARVRRFQAPSGFEGWMLARLTAGFAPPDGALNLLSEVLLMGLLRAVAVSYLFVWSRMIAKHRQQTSTRAAEVKDQECSGEKK